MSRTNGARGAVCPPRADAAAPCAPPVGLPAPFVFFATFVLLAGAALAGVGFAGVGFAGAA